MLRTQEISFNHCMMVLPAASMLQACRQGTLYDNLILKQLVPAAEPEISQQWQHKLNEKTMIQHVHHLEYDQATRCQKILSPEIPTCHASS